VKIGYGEPHHGSTATGEKARGRVQRLQSFTPVIPTSIRQPAPEPQHVLCRPAEGGHAVPGSTRARRLPVALFALMILVGAESSPAGAQALREADCPDGRIGSVQIENNSVFDLDDPGRGGRFGWVYRLANRLHVQTRSEVIERELLIRAGECYQVELLRDSERLLRNFGFLADAHVYGIRREDGSVDVLVDTRDEWSARVQPVMGPGGPGLRGLRLVEDNLMGTGRHLGLFYEREAQERIFGASYWTPHLFRSRWNMGAHLARTEVGYSFGQAVTYPFVGETGRRAFRQVYTRDERFFEMLVPEQEGGFATALIPLRRERSELAAAARWGGERYRSTLIGVAVANERISYPGWIRFPGDQLPLDRPHPPSLPHWTPVSSVRAMLLAGQRNTSFVRRRALDTIDGTEDVLLGLEADVAFGPTLPGLSTDDDLAVGLGLFAAGEALSRLLIGGELNFEARRSNDSPEEVPEWNDVMAELDGWAYFRRSVESRHTLVAALSAVGGWHPRAPLQLTLGGDAGLRGFPRHSDLGARRVVASVEHRSYLAWPLPDLFDLGSVVFLDVGQIWAGDLAFGMDSPVRASAGFGVRAAFPPGSRQTFRLDVGVPLQQSAGFGDVVLSMGVGQAIGRQAARRDPQLLRSARYGLRPRDFLQAGRQR
jgi:hypothetical protein